MTLNELEMRMGVGNGVHDAHPHLLLVLLGPVCCARQRSWPGRCEAHCRQQPGRFLLAR